MDLNTLLLILIIILIIILAIIIITKFADSILKTKLFIGGSDSENTEGGCACKYQPPVNQQNQQNSQNLIQKFFGSGDGCGCSKQSTYGSGCTSDHIENSKYDEINGGVDKSKIFSDGTSMKSTVLYSQNFTVSEKVYNMIVPTLEKIGDNEFKKYLLKLKQINENTAKIDLKDINVDSVKYADILKLLELQYRELGKYGTISVDDLIGLLNIRQIWFLPKPKQIYLLDTFGVNPTTNIRTQLKEKMAEYSKIESENSPIFGKLLTLAKYNYKIKDEHLTKSAQQLQKLGPNAIDLDLIAMGPFIKYALSTPETKSAQTISDKLNEINLLSMRLIDPDAVRKFITRIRDDINYIERDGYSISHSPILLVNTAEYYKQRIRELEDKNRQLQTDNMHLQDKLKDNKNVDSAKLNSLQDQIDQKNRELQNCETKLHSKETELNHLQVQQEEQTHTMKNLEQNMGLKMQELNDLQVQQRELDLQQQARIRDAVNELRA